MRIVNNSQTKKALIELNPGDVFVHGGVAYMRLNDSGIRSKLDLFDGQCMVVSLPTGEPVALNRSTPVQFMDDSVLSLEQTNS